MGRNVIKIRGAREHNLKSVSLDIPRDRLTVITGLSGSGKSSLAFDTIYAEGQRRYMQSLSSYARQFLGQMEKPDIDAIEGLSPAISIDQKSTNRNPRSTVGTVTEIHDYLRLLYARIGLPHCPNCGREIRRQTVDEIADRIMALPEGSRIMLLSPVVKGKKGRHEKVLSSAQKSGYVRARIDGSLYDLSEDISLDKNLRHTIEIIVDRLVVRPGIELRLSESIEQVVKLSEGEVRVSVIGGEEINYSTNYACPDCGVSIEEIEPRSFSFNNPFGACPECSGLGFSQSFDPSLMIDETLSINEGAISVLGWYNSKDEGSFSHAVLKALSLKYGFSLDRPFSSLSKEAKDAVIYGTGTEKVTVHFVSQFGKGNVHDIAFEGLLQNVTRRYKECFSDSQKAEYELFMKTSPCPLCGGMRLKKTSLAVTVGGKNIHEVSELSVKNFLFFMENLCLSDIQKKIGSEILKEIRLRAKFLVDVGLDYLTLSRSAGTLSGGEAQRIRLATQIGSGLVGVIYILDEPSIGLHQRDNDRLIKTLTRLRDLGNTVIVVEHDEDTMRSADWIIDIGPGAGENGGRVMAEGKFEDIIKNPNSITGDYLSGRKSIPLPRIRRRPAGFLLIRNARENNLKNIDVRIPLGVFTVVTGVSGSGKSSLINEILYKTLAKKLNRARMIPGKADDIEGTGLLDKVVNIDQSPIGRTPRSNPATYTGVFDLIRDLFSTSPDARAKGFNKGRFSFNVKGGRCEACQGDGIMKIEMHFLPDVYVPCEVCGGKRFNRETLDVKYKGKTIYDVLEMTAGEALEFFENIPQIKRKLTTLCDVGLQYVKLGQPSTQLSGGEAQRIKLAAELSRRATGKTIYVLDEPTTGLHFDDVNKLVTMLRTLSENGNTVVVIEHNMDVIKCADYIIDMGPEGGENGGTVVAEGTPEEIVKADGSYTGKYLKRYLMNGGRNASL